MTFHRENDTNVPFVIDGEKITQDGKFETYDLPKEMGDPYAFFKVQSKTHDKAMLVFDRFYPISAKPMYQTVRVRFCKDISDDSTCTVVY